MLEKQIHNRIWNPPCFSLDEWTYYIQDMETSVCKGCTEKFRKEMKEEDRCARYYHKDINGPGRPRSKESKAIQSLGIGQSISFDCKWNHNKGICAVKVVISRERKNGKHFSYVCKDRVVSIRRVN